MPIPQNSIEPIPLYVPSASGNFAGDASLSGLSVTIEYAGAAPFAAAGKVVPGSNGTYWFYPSQTDFGRTGNAVVRLAGVPGTDIPVPFMFDVRPPSLLQAALSVPGSLTTIISLLQRLVTAERA